MPVVPRYGQQASALPQVAPAPRPNVQVGPEASPSAFGVPGGIDLSGAQRVAVDLWDKARQRANQVAALDADNQLHDLAQDLYYHPQTGAFNVLGKDAIGAADKAREAWAKGVGEIGNGLSNDDQRLAFQRRSQAQRFQLDDAAAAHVNAQIQQYDKGETLKALDKRRDLAIASPDKPAIIQGAIAEQRAIWSDYARAHGLGPEATAQGLAETVSATHAAVISQMLANGNDLDAQGYYAQHQAEIVGNDSTQIAKEMDIGSLRGESQRQADTITAVAVNPAGALEAANRIADPKLRDATVDRVRAFYDEQNHAKALDAENAFQEAGTILEQRGSFDAIPPALLSRMTYQQRDALRNDVDRLRKQRTERTTDPQLYYNLMNMAGVNDFTRRDFENINLMQFRSQLSDTDFERLVQLQRTERLQTQGAIAGEARRDATAAQKEAEKAAERERAKQTLRDMGIEIPDTVPGGPIQPPATPPSAQQPKGAAQGTLRTPVPAGSTSGRMVPQSWLDRAARDPAYRLYLQHMGINVP